MKKIFLGQTSRVLRDVMREDDVATFTVDADAEAKRLSTSVSTAAWTTESGNAAAASEALASNVATALVTVPDEETTVLKVKLTMADGQIRHQFINITVRDPNSANVDIWGTP